jgi:hypothetical protein
MAILDAPVSPSTGVSLLEHAVNIIAPQIRMAAIIQFIIFFIFLISYVYT